MNRQLLSIAALTLLTIASASGHARAPGPRASSTIRVIPLDSQAVGGVRRYTVYLPPGYDADARRSYSLLVALHGLGGQGSDWLTMGQLRETLDTMIGAGTMRPLVVVMPDGGSGYWTNHLGRPRARFGDYVVEEVIADVRRRFNVATTGSRLGIVGVSMGGHGALSIGLQYPDRFAAIASVAGALFPRPPTHRSIYKKVWGDPPDQVHWDRTSPLALMARLRPSDAPAIYLHCGDDDEYGFLAYALRAHEILNQRKVAHQLRVSDGGHSWALWRDAAGDWLAFFDAHLR